MLTRMDDVPYDAASWARLSEEQREWIIRKRADLIPESKDRKSMRFSVTHTPDDDVFTTVTLMAHIRSEDGLAVASVHEEVSPEEGRAYAAKIIAACEIVERDREATR